MREYSPTYVSILLLLKQYKGTDNFNYSTKYTDGIFERTRLDTTTIRLPQTVTVIDKSLRKKCTLSEWGLIGEIFDELKEYNVLWENINKSSGNNRKVVKGLIDKDILIPTETKHIYIVNPLYIRRGEFFTVLTTTANMLKNKARVASEDVVNKKPINRIDISEDILQPNRQIGYGYVIDDTK